MAEGSDVLLDRLDRVMKDDFNAKMLGCVGRGRLTDVKFLGRTLGWHEQEVCFSWSGGTRNVTELAVLLGLSGEGKWWMRSRCPGAAGYLSCSNLLLSGGIDRIHRPGQISLPVCGERGVERCFGGYEARLDANVASGQVPGGPQRTRMALSGAGCACEVHGVRRLGLGRLGNAKEHNRNIRTAWTASHRIQLLDSARRRSFKWRGRNRTAAGGLQSVQLVAEAGMDLKLEVLTDSTANFGMHNRMSSGGECGTWT